MPNVERDLIPDETLVYKTNLHWIVLVGPFALATILGIAGLLLFARPKFLHRPIR